MLMERHKVNRTILCSNFMEIELVEAANHSAITLGFNVLIKNPVTNNLACLLPVTFMMLFVSSCFSYFLKNT